MVERRWINAFPKNISMKWINDFIYKDDNRYSKLTKY